jgi:hypothetical protein
MPLTHSLDDTVLSLACPYCGHLLKKPGKSFFRAGKVRCTACSSVFKIRYEDKLRMFATAQKRLEINSSPDLPLAVASASSPASGERS